MLNNDLPSRLKSWAMWNELARDGFWKNSKYVFPGDYLSYMQAENHNGMCPLCENDGGEVMLRDQGWFCICASLKWQGIQKQMLRDVSSIYEPTTLAKLLPAQAVIGPNSGVTLEDAIVVAEDFIRNPSRWIVYSGGTGIGKSHILRSIAWAMRPIALYITASDLEHLIFKSLKPKDDGSADLSELIEVVKWAPVLLLDDLGAEYGSPLIVSKIMQIIDHRDRTSDLPVVVATNLNREQVRGIHRVGSRLLDTQRSIFHEIKVLDFRQKQRRMPK